MTIKPLSQNYTEARQAFLSAANAAGARLSEFPHPMSGPEGEDLSIDVAEFGPADAESVLLIVSATHGVEGFAGSALQRRWLEEHTAERPADVRVVMVHAFNPYGFAWVRRVNEDNVDLNRNFIDWNGPAPLAPDYMGIADIVVPASWSEEEQERTFGLLLEYLNEVGMEKLQATISGGQYEDPKGVFYGGAEPVWSHRWLRQWVTEHMTTVKRLGILDLHTGLGDNGTAQFIGANGPETEAHRRACEWFGEVIPMGGQDSVSAALSGDWLGGICNIMPEVEITGVAIEYGTVDTISVMQALRADAWLHGYGDPVGPDSAAIQAQVRAAFADDGPHWVEAIWGPFASCVDKAFIQLEAVLDLTDAQAESQRRDDSSGAADDSLLPG